MKKLFVILLVALMVVSLAACGGDEPTQGNAPSNPTSNPTAAPTQKPTSGDSSVYSGEVTEQVVRNYKTAKESDFEVAEVTGGVRISGYNGNDTIVVIPETINGQKVVEIGGYIFANDSTVKGVYIPEDITKLPVVFGNNKNLEVVICEGVETIGNNAFINCEALHTVILGDNLTAIGESAFYNCVSLKELYIASTVEEIDEDYALTIFLWCENLTITGEAGSFIESFCAEHDIPFEAK